VRFAWNRAELILPTKEQHHIATFLALVLVQQFIPPWVSAKTVF
jgi:hypothetical protein